MTIGTSPNDPVGKMTKVRGALHILGVDVGDDPLDPIAAAAPYLAQHYSAVRLVGPGREMSVRAMRLAFDPAADRLLYDFTAPGDLDWALAALRSSPAAALVAEHSPVRPRGVLSDLRSAQRYAVGGLRIPAAITVGALEASPAVPIDQMLTRPATTIRPIDSAALVIAVAPGAIEGAYAGLLGLSAVNEQPIQVMVGDRRTAEDLSAIIEAVAPSAALRLAMKRADIASVVAGAVGVIDVAADDRRGLGDAAFAAKCLGAPVLTVTSAEEAASSVHEFAEQPLGRDPARAAAFVAGRPASAFAEALIGLIEAGHSRAALLAEAA